MLHAYIWENIFGWSILTYSKVGIYSFTFGHKNKTDALIALNQQLPLSINSKSKIQNLKSIKYDKKIQFLWSEDVPTLPDNRSVDSSWCRSNYAAQSANYLIQNVSKEIWLNNLVSTLNHYFEGRNVEFTCYVDLSWCTKFQKTVLLETFKIPYGRILTYSQIAQKIKHPAAYRAVGNALGSNKIPIIIPCHRVIRLNGSLGGFTGGLAIKQKLLNLEYSILPKILAAFV